MSKALFESLKMDLPALADLIRSKGRGRDTMLAHITPREAALLKKRGGSDTVNPDTGLPEFEDSGDYSFEAAPPSPVYDVVNQQGQFQPTYTETKGAEAGAQMPVGQSYTPGDVPIDYSQLDIGFGPGQYGPAAPSVANLPGRTFTPQESAMYGFTEAAPTPKGVVTPPGKEKEDVFSGKDLARLGIGTTVLGGLTAANLARTRQAAGQARTAGSELEALGTPYKAAGTELTRAAAAGELSPVNQQVLKAAQAQANQAIATRGGVGQQQAQNAIADLTARLLQNQYDLGLKVMNIGDQYAAGAIRTSLQADQAIGAANQQFYTALAQMSAPFLLGQAPVYTIGGRT